MKLHVLGLPHTVTDKKFSTCAFTQKVVKLCAMMHRRGHHVIHYGVESSNVECTEHVSITSLEEWGKYYSHPGTAFYEHDGTKPHLVPYIELYKTRVAEALRQRAGKREDGLDATEIVCMTWGGPQRDAIRTALGDANGNLSQWEVETGIGYEHSWSPYRVYESYAWMHVHLGMERILSGAKWYWSVIPNSFDLNDLMVADKPGEDFLFMGRLNDDKGVGLAIHVAKEVGRKITICGQGDPTHLLAGNPHVTYLPPVDVEGRRELLANAYAVFCPSFYIEPFCGTHVEAMLSGTPVITTDWGVFAETVLHGVTGWRCRSFEHFVWAAKNVDKLDREATWRYAAENFSLERVALMYEEYFQNVLNLKYTPGFYTKHPERRQLDWLKKPIPHVWRYIDLQIPFIAPPIPEPVLDPTTWKGAQQWEHEWWGLDWNTKWDDEIRKQAKYFKLLDFPDDYDFGEKTVLDIGCGPISMLQRSLHGFSRGVDPLPVSEETVRRYADAHIDFLNIKAEEMPAPGYAPIPTTAGSSLAGTSLEPLTFDEIWMYNCLQHVDDPHEILRRLIACAHPGTVVRIFEWIDLGICPGHPQNLTEEMFEKHFADGNWRSETWNVGFLRGFGGTATEKYLAIVAVRK